MPSISELEARIGSILTHQALIAKRVVNVAEKLSGMPSFVDSDKVTELVREMIHAELYLSRLSYELISMKTDLIVWRDGSAQAQGKVTQTMPPAKYEEPK